MVMSVNIATLLSILGAIGVMWGVIWWFTSFERPSTHPRISYEERTYIEESLGLADNTVIKV